MPVALSWDPYKQRLYWVDGTKNVILYTSFAKREAPLLLLGNLSDVKDVDVDWIGGNVYYVDAGNSHIGVVTSNGDYRAILISLSIEKPVSLALDVERR